MESENIKTYIIELTEKEKDLFHLFKSFVKSENMNSILRVAGGWVRDKLLGKHSEDIDIAIDNMSGEDFVKKAKEYFIKINLGDIHGFGVTKFNPEKSKHLETATIKIKDFWIDFVNLRGETYGESRVPEIRIGTAKEDAFRRDLTINALFYNLMTDEVEDFTQKGLDDLKNGIIRTPLDPYSTFFDDPLRILRTFRFASRFQFKVVDNISECLKHQEILIALRNKVSRERIGKEVHQSMNHFTVFTSLRYFYENNLWDIIFDVSPVLKNENIKLYEKHNFGYQLCQLIYKNEEKLKILDVATKFNNPQTILFLLYLSSACYPFEEYKIEKNKNTPTIIQYIIKESLKFTNAEAQHTQNIVQNVKTIQSFIKFYPDFNVKREISDFIREIGNLWELSFVLSQFVEKLKVSDSNELNLIEIKYKALLDYIYNQKLHLAFQFKPLIDGTDVIKLLKVKPGPAVKEVLNNIIFWQIQNQSSTKDDLLKIISENEGYFF